jgi:hypothetical protein
MDPGQRIRSEGNSMRPRRLGVGAALALALLIPTSAALADTMPPTGSYLNIGWTACQGSACTDASVEIDSPKKGAPQVCATLVTGDTIEQGCASTIGALVWSGKFLTGVASTNVTVDDGDSATPPRTVAVAVASSITSGPTADAGCSVPQAWHDDVVQLAGSITVDADTGPATGSSFNVATRTVKKC